MGWDLGDWLLDRERAGELERSCTCHYRVWLVEKKCVKCYVLQYILFVEYTFHSRRWPLALLDSRGRCRECVYMHCVVSIAVYACTLPCVVLYCTLTGQRTKTCMRAQ